MTEQAVSFITSEEEAKVREDRTDAPELFTLDSGQLPFERMGDAHFELLVADVYRSELEDEPEDWYDTVSRLNDGADQGRDVILFKDGNPVGVVQCKRLKKRWNLKPLSMRSASSFYMHISGLKSHQSPAQHLDTMWQSPMLLALNYLSLCRERGNNVSRI